MVKLATEIMEEEGEDGASSVGNYSYVYEPFSDKTNKGNKNYNSIQKSKVTEYVQKPILKRFLK